MKKKTSFSALKNVPMTKLTLILIILDATHANKFFDENQQSRGNYLTQQAAARARIDNS